MRKSEVLTLSLSPRFSEEIKKMMKKENLTRSELIRDALRSYLKERERWREIRKWGEMTKKRFKIKGEKEIEEMINQTRS